MTYLSYKKTWLQSCILPLQQKNGGKMKTSQRILKNQKGQGVMEYVIISSLVGIICITAVKSYGKVIKERIDDMKESLTREIKNQ